MTSAKLWAERCWGISPSCPPMSGSTPLLRGASLADLAALSEENEATTLKPQTQARIWGQLQHFLDWCVQSGELEANPWEGLTVKAKPEVSPHGVLTDAQVVLLLSRKDWVLHNILLFCLLTGLRSGEACGLLAEDVISKGNLGRFVRVAPNDIRQLKSRGSSEGGAAAQHPGEPAGYFPANYRQAVPYDDSG